MSDKSNDELLGLFGASKHVTVLDRAPLLEWARSPLAKTFAAMLRRAAQVMRKEAADQLGYDEFSLNATAYHAGAAQGLENAAQELESLAEAKK